VPKASSKKIPIGKGVEAEGLYIIDSIRVDGTEQGAIDAVSIWVAEHPSYSVEAITPIYYYGGGDSSLRLATLLVLGKRDYIERF
jgi:hypothetical protein